MFMFSKIPFVAFNASSQERILAAVYIMFSMLLVIDLVTVALCTFDINSVSVGKHDEQF